MMILRGLTLSVGLLAGASASQFPEFSQQYAQRLGGAVDALSEVVADFDASAVAEGLTRSAALDQMRGADFIERRRRDMERTFTRHAKLSADLDALKNAGPFVRAYNATRLTDRDIAQAAWNAFEPAVPLSAVGAIFSGLGFLLGVIASCGVLGLLRAMIRRLRGRDKLAQG